MLILAAGGRHRALLEMRREYGLSPASKPMENAHPVVAITTVMFGGFRGMVADLLWLRISYMQEKGNYFEIVQLSDWITKLEPHCTEVWAYHAWNMAYNISVMMADYEDRWRWVNNGIRLLRDEGLAYNPGDPALYRELGWLYQHKIGMTSDLAHELYKKKLFDEMNDLLEGPRPDYSGITGKLDRRLRREYKLLPELMKEIEDKHGPMDWRNPYTHGIYWATRGLKETDSSMEIEISRCQLMVDQCLMALKKRKK
jgi:hypothetical protein